MLSEKEFTEMVEAVRQAYLKRDECYPELLAEFWVTVKIKGLSSPGATLEFLEILKREMRVCPMPLPLYLRAWLFKEKVELDEEGELKYLLLKHVEGRSSWLDRMRIKRFMKKVPLSGVWKQVADSL
jgi:hypothetical protein